MTVTDAVEDFLFEVGRLESFTLFSLTFMDAVEEAFANTLRLKVLNFYHVRFACSCPCCVFVLSLLVFKFDSDDVSVTDAFTLQRTTRPG